MPSRNWRALQDGFEAGEAGALGRAIGEDLAADAPREDAANDERTPLLTQSSLIV